MVLNFNGFSGLFWLVEVSNASKIGVPGVVAVILVKVTLYEGKNREIRNVLPLIVHRKRNDELDDNFYIRRFNDKICLDTFVTVISEAQCGDGDETVFISEKTYKVIACRQPFIIMGNKETLRKLRDTGYRTFDGS